VSEQGPFDDAGPRAAGDPSELAQPEPLASSASGEAALRWLRHQIRNELQLLTSLTALHVRRVDDERARRELVRCYRRIGVVGVVHQLSADAGGTVSADVCLNTVADFIEASARTMETARSFDLDLDLASLRWRHDHATRIALIVDELFANAMDHALPHSQNPTIVLTLTRIEGRACLSLRDFGPGVPEGFEPSAGETLGLPMACAVAQQLGGALELGRAPGGGTEAKLWLPLDMPLAAGASA
jgi:two-component sensor histidine kinase